MDVVEKGMTSLRKANRLWNIPLTSLSNHPNGRTRTWDCVNSSKRPNNCGMGLAMQKVGLSITLM